MGGGTRTLKVRVIEALAREDSEIERERGVEERKEGEVISTITTGSRRSDSQPRMRSRVSTRSLARVIQRESPR